MYYLSWNDWLLESDTVSIFKFIHWNQWLCTIFVSLLISFFILITLDFLQQKLALRHKLDIWFLFHEHWTNLIKPRGLNSGENLDLFLSMRKAINFNRRSLYFVLVLRVFLEYFIFNLLSIVLVLILLLELTLSHCFELFYFVQFLKLLFYFCLFFSNFIHSFEVSFYVSFEAFVTDFIICRVYLWIHNRLTITIDPYFSKSFLKTLHNRIFLKITVIIGNGILFPHNVLPIPLWSLIFSVKRLQSLLPNLHNLISSC